jgi:hypothetical protein
MRGVQIKHTVPCSLDLSTGSYNQWHNMMELVVEEYGVLDQLREDTASATPNLEWRTIDLILKRWIYGSISSELTAMDHAKMACQLCVAGRRCLTQQQTYLHRPPHL